MPDESELAHSVANAVLARMRVDGGPPWTVLAAAAAAPRTDPSGVFHIRVSIGAGNDSSVTVAVYFTAGVPLEDAVVATASQLQDHAVEATGGMALPACPNHPHPLAPRVFDRTAQWVCPKGPDHHREPILTAGQRSGQRPL